MKYLAILRDSLREALDSKVLYVMIGLSVLVVLFFASMSFTPLPADKGLESMVAQFPSISPFSTGFAPRFSVKYSVEDVEQLNDARPWAGQYRFKLVATNQQREGFRIQVLVWCLRTKTPILDDGGEAEKQFQKLREDVEKLPPDEREDYIEKQRKDMVQKVARKTVGPEQIEKFVKAQFSDHGSFVATKVTPKETTDSEMKLEVEAHGSPDNFSVWPHSQGLFFGAIGGDGERGSPPGYLVYLTQDWVLGRIGASVAMLIATVITAFFIPNMLQKGTIDLLLVKPVHRGTLLLFKYLGGLSFMFLITTFVVLGTWLAIGLRSNLWGSRFLLLVPILTFQFAIFYAVSTLFAVLTRSIIVSIVMTCLTWLVLFVVGVFLYSPVKPEEKLARPRSTFAKTMDVVHYVLPRYTDIVSLSGKEIIRDTLPESNFLRKGVEQSASVYSWPESLLVSSAFIALMLGLSCWWFATRDY
jgi:ABC-type transport system involved in multi-copper enzyme maturation permease subunit